MEMDLRKKCPPGQGMRDLSSIPTPSDVDEGYLSESSDIIYR